MNFFYNQGITIVTIQPEFKVKSDDDDDNNDKQIHGMSFVQCLMGCQSLECAPKTCCSTNDLQLISSHDGENGNVGDGKLGKAAAASAAVAAAKTTKEKSGGKSRSLLSLNVTSLMKLRRFTGSTQDIMKKCASESQVTQIGGDDGVGSESKNPSSTISTPPSTANNSQLVNNSIDELKETEFHEQCGERSEKRMPTQENLSRSHQIESMKHCEDSSLLTKSSIDDCNESQEIDQNSHIIHKSMSNDSGK